MSPLSGPFRAPSSGAAPDSLIVLLHGIGANGEDLIGLADVLAPRFPKTAFHSPDAPDPFAEAGFGFQWFPREPRASRGERVRGAESAVNAYIDGLLDEYKLGPDRCVLAGFSQGCMVALHTGPRRERQLAGVIGMSGSLITADTLEAEAQEQAARRARPRRRGHGGRPGRNGRGGPRLRFAGLRRRGPYPAGPRPRDRPSRIGDSGGVHGARAGVVSLLSRTRGGRGRRRAWRR